MRPGGKHTRNSPVDLCFRFLYTVWATGHSGSKKFEETPRDTDTRIKHTFPGDISTSSDLRTSPTPHTRGVRFVHTEDVTCNGVTTCNVLRPDVIKR